MKRITCCWFAGAAVAVSALPVCAQQPNAMVYWRMPLGGTTSEQDQAQFGLTFGYTRPQVLGPPLATVRPPSIEFNFKRDGFDGLRVGGYNTRQLFSEPQPGAPRSAASRADGPAANGGMSLGQWWSSRQSVPPDAEGVRPSIQGAEGLMSSPEPSGESSAEQP
jgi:hypothetical protein